MNTHSQKQHKNQKILPGEKNCVLLFMNNVHIIVYNHRHVEMKKILEGATNYVILPATMVGRRRKFFISSPLKGLEKLNICRREVM